MGEGVGRYRACQVGNARVFFFQFLSYTIRLSLVPPPEEKFGRSEPCARPTDKGLASNFLDESINLRIPIPKCSVRIYNK